MPLPDGRSPLTGSTSAASGTRPDGSKYAKVYSLILSVGRWPDDRLLQRGGEAPEAAASAREIRPAGESPGRHEDAPRRSGRGAGPRHARNSRAVGQDRDRPRAAGRGAGKPGIAMTTKDGAWLRRWPG